MAYKGIEMGNFERKWLVNFKHVHNAYCFCCKLFMKFDVFILLFFSVIKTIILKKIIHTL